MNTLLFTILQISTSGDLKGGFNQILTDYGVPIVAFIIVATGVYGVVKNLDLIMDNYNRGTRK